MPHSAPASSALDIAPLVISCGEPAGIGPELAWAARIALGARCPFAWVGDPRHLPRHAKICEIDTLRDVIYLAEDVLPVLVEKSAQPSQPGKLDPRNALSVISALDRAVDLVQSGQASGLVTAPIHKKALRDGAGFAFPGHTEYLAARAGGQPVAMMLASKMLRVVPATIHIPLSHVASTLTQEQLETTIRLTHQGLRTLFDIEHPRIAIAGLNPHAGEGGLMGDEETRIMAPVIDKLQREGMDIRGPLSADTMFHTRARAQYDAAVCAYHDQALIPIKTLDFDGGVNVTLGLPFIRCSPDHGTALDIAGKNIANPGSMIAACEMAWKMAHSRATTMAAQTT